MSPTIVYRPQAVIFFSLFKIDRLLFSFRARALISKIRRRRSAVVICRDQYSAAAFIGFSNCTCLYLPPCVSFEEALLNVHFSLRRVSPFNALRQIIYLLTSSLPSYLLQSLSVFASSELIFSSSIFKLRFCFFFPFSFLRNRHILPFPYFGSMPHKPTFSPSVFPRFLIVSRISLSRLLMFSFAPLLLFVILHVPLISLVQAQI